MLDFVAFELHFFSFRICFAEVCSFNLLVLSNLIFQDEKGREKSIRSMESIFEKIQTGILLIVKAF